MLMILLLPDLLPLLLTSWFGPCLTLFSIKDLGPLEYFLGLEASYNSGGMTLTQRKYVLDLLLHVNMENCNPTPTPLVPSERLARNTEALLGPEDSSRYRSVVGSLQYLTHKHPDIYFVVN
jgi:hypothetical protein